MSNVQRLSEDKSSEYYPLVKVHVPLCLNQSNNAQPLHNWNPIGRGLKDLNAEENAVEYTPRDMRMFERTSGWGIVADWFGRQRISMDIRLLGLGVMKEWGDRVEKGQHQILSHSIGKFFYLAYFIILQWVFCLL